MIDNNYDIAIVGGGLAGLTAGIHLRLAGKRVCIFEKHQYPKHKVCGEYVSNEVKPYLESLGINIDSHSVDIQDFKLSSENGKSVSCKLPLGGFGISRFALDEILHRRALNLGVDIIHESVQSITFDNDIFEIKDSNKIVVKATFCLGAYGKRSGIDRNMNRDFAKKRSPWLAVKAHYVYDGNINEVALHHFEGGYCGLSKVETGHVNACYLVHQSVFERYKDIDKLQKHVLSNNKHLKHLFQKGKLAWEKPLSISQIYFGNREKIVDHVIMIGDAGGMIHPLAGNGMAIAIHTAKIIAEIFIEYAFDENKRSNIEKAYIKEWNKYFKKRITVGRIIQGIFENRKWSNRLMNLVPIYRSLIPIIIKQTHGKRLIPAKF